MDLRGRLVDAAFGRERGIYQQNQFLLRWMHLLGDSGTRDCCRRLNVSNLPRLILSRYNLGTMRQKVYIYIYISGINTDSLSGWYLDCIHLSASARQDGDHYYQDYIEHDVSSNGSQAQLMNETPQYGWRA